jgi:hypothetical protein
LATPLKKAGKMRENVQSTVLVEPNRIALLNIQLVEILGRKKKDGGAVGTVISSPMAWGRPSKHARNTSGLRNKSKGSLVTPAPVPETAVENLDLSHDSRESSPDDHYDVGMYFDSTRPIVGNDDAGCESDIDVDEVFESKEWEDEELRDNMCLLAVQEGDDPSDEDWFPPGLRRKKKQKIGEFLYLSY